jgi:hypothetical protein
LVSRFQKVNILVLIKFSHKAKPITIVDLSNLKAADAIKTIGEAQKEIATLPSKSALLVTDVSNTEITTEFINVVIDFAKKNSPYVKASASVGGGNKLVGVISFNVASNAGRKINSFNTRTEAMDWLVSQP